MHEAECSQATSSSSDGRSCSEKIQDCCDCLKDECHVESGDSADSVSANHFLARASLLVFITHGHIVTSP